MRILLTNNALHHRYGSEAWTYAMAKELTGRGHQVRVFTLYPGTMSEKISEFAEIVYYVEDNYDLALVNHRNCYEHVPKSIFRIFTSHSTWIDIEQFPVDANICIGVSEETARGHAVIRNGIDCMEFDNFRPISALRTVLYLSHPDYAGDRDVVRKACKGLELIIIEQEEFDMAPLIDRADLVIGFGRGLMEAMACGRNVVSADHRPYYMKQFCGGGMVDDSNFDELKRSNFTGRPYQTVFTAESLRAEIEKYDVGRNWWLRNRMLDEFNVQKTAQQYLDLFLSAQI